MGSFTLVVEHIAVVERESPQLSNCQSRSSESASPSVALRPGRHLDWMGAQSTGKLLSHSQVIPSPCHFHFRQIGFRRNKSIATSAIQQKVCTKRFGKTSMSRLSTRER